MKKIKYWIWASRPQTLIASIAPVFTTSILCFKYYIFNINIFLFTILAAILIQVMTNLINDLYDYKKGSDREGRIGPIRVVQKNLLSENEVKNAIKFLLIILILIGLYLVSHGGIAILLVGLSSFLFAYLYTATKFSIAYNGLGEIFVFTYFGIVASLGTFYLQTLTYNYSIFLLGALFGCLNICLLVINNLRDFQEDVKSSKNTLIVKLGYSFGKIEFIFINILSFIFLYALSSTLHNNTVFYNLCPLMILNMVVIYKTLSDINFLNYKALPFFSMYITLFTLLLSLFI